MSDAKAGGEPKRLSHYELHEVVGTGGMGTVYKAIDLRSRVIVAVKTVHPHLQEDPSYVERLRREAHIASLLSSPYVVRILDFGSDAGQYFMVSEFVEGQKLSDILRGGPMAAVQALAIVVQVALALDEAEGRGVVHRDIKPDNVIITPDHAVKVLDFGIARLNMLAGVTTTGLFIGTMTYAAPEQFLGHADTRSDIYAVGVMLFQMLAGQPPFHAATPTGLMRMHEDTPPPLELLKGVPAPLVAVVERCLQKSPDDRYQHAAELLGGLESARRSLTDAQTDSWMSDATAVLRIPPSGADPTAIAGAPDATLVARSPTRAPAASLGDPTLVAPAGAAAPQRQAGAGATSGGASPPVGGAPVAAGGGDSRAPLFIGLAAAAAIAVAIIVAVVVFARSGGESGSVVAGRTATALANGNGTQDRGTPGVPAATATAVAAGTAAAATTIAQSPASSIAEGEWSIRLISRFNDCNFGIRVGDIANTTFTFTRVTTDPSDGFITDGDTVSVVDSGGNPIADQTFSYPTFNFQWVRINIDAAFRVVTANVVTNIKFLNSNEANVSQNEFYGVDSDGDGVADTSCRISYEDADARS